MKKVFLLISAVVVLLMLNTFALFSISDLPTPAAPDSVEPDTMCCQFQGRCPSNPNGMSFYCNLGHNGFVCRHHVCEGCTTGGIIN